jgi:hypothetical protein
LIDNETNICEILELIITWDKNGAALQPHHIGSKMLIVNDLEVAQFYPLFDHEGQNKIIGT